MTLDFTDTYATVKPEYLAALERVATAARIIVMWRDGECGDDFGVSEWPRLGRALADLERLRP